MTHDEVFDMTQQLINQRIYERNHSMKVFAIFGDIEFLDDYENTALIRKTHSCAFMDEDEVEDHAIKHGWDYITPHYFNGRITFMQFHKEQ